MKSPKTIYAAVIAILLSVTFFVLSPMANEDEKAEQSMPGEGEQFAPSEKVIEVYELELSSQTIKQNLPGRIHAFRTAEVRARVSGIIEKRTFSEGSNVSEGDELFKIEDQSYQALYNARKADLANAISVYDLSKATVNRYKKLNESGTVSQQEFDTYLSQAAQAKAQVEQAKANAEVARINLEYATVTAPISGRVDMAMVTEGALTSAGITQLAVIEQIDKVYVQFSRSSSEFQKLKNALKKDDVSDSESNLIEIQFDDGSFYSEKGTLEFSSMSVDPTTGAITLRAVVDNPNQDLLPGMFVRVVIPVIDAENVLKVPQKSVEVTSTGTVVSVIEEGALKKVPVTLADMTEDGFWIVVDGLKAGDRVIVTDPTTAGMSGMPLVGKTAEELAKAMGESSETPQANTSEENNADSL